MNNLTKISVIIPCFNMQDFIRETLESIISQGYENLELIIIDGGSSDNTLNIINDYKSHITYLVSEPDDGQYDAINKGLIKSTGDLITWLNADDLFFPWTLSSVNTIFKKNPEINWVIGRQAFINSSSNSVQLCSKNGSKPRKLIMNGFFQSKYFGYLQQESMFWKKELLDKAGAINTQYELAADFELWTRFSKYSELVVIDFPIACFRRRNDSRSVKQKEIYDLEVNEVFSKLNKNKKFYYLFIEKNIILRFIIRLFFIRETTAIRHNIKNNNLEKFTTFRSTSNYSIFELFTEFLYRYKR